jgi:multidrug efflux pump subunit AcrA (membrane-fusion protein)
MRKKIILAAFCLIIAKTGRPEGNASPAAESAPIKSGEIQKLEETVRNAEAKLKAIQGQVTAAALELQIARIALEAGQAEEELKMVAGNKDKKSRELAKALDFKAKTLKNITVEDFPAIQALEAKLSEARAGLDPAGITAAQQALNIKRLGLIRKQTEVETKMAKASGDETRTKLLENRIEQIRRQEKALGNPVPEASKLK